MGLNKEPWGPGTPWKNSTAFFTYLRGCLRKAWSRNPVKLNLLKKLRKQIPNPNPKGHKETVWGADCAMCGGTFVLKDIQVDHIVAAGQLNKTEDIQGFVERLLYVSEDNLRLVCKTCNNALAHADKQGISYEDALIEKKVIAMEKEKSVIPFLNEKGISPGKNAKERRQQLVEVLKKEYNE